LVSFSGGGFGVELFVSTDASGTAFRESLPITSPTLTDDPNISVSSDKVVVASESCVWTLDKSAVIAGGAAPVSPTTSAIQHGDQIWAVQYRGAAPGTAYLVAIGQDSAHINWISVDGTPAQHNVVLTQHIVAIPPLAASPAILEANGVAMENNAVLAMWNAGHVWWSRTEGCGSVTCARMFDVQLILPRFHGHQESHGSAVGVFDHGTEAKVVQRGVQGRGGAPLQGRGSQHRPGREGSRALREWVKRADVDAGQGPPGALTTVEREELARLRKQVKRLEMEREM
jgi:hypothetical protein